MKRLLFLSLPLLSVACELNSKPLDDSGSDTADTDATCTVTPVVFDYTDQDSWIEDEETCGKSSQSPVDIVFEEYVYAEHPGLTFEYGETPLHIINNGHSIEYKVEEGSSLLRVGDTAYTLEQFHFHAPSEHTIDGQHLPMEMHMVHTTEAGAVAVVAIFIAEGEEQPWFKAAQWEDLPETAGSCIEDEETKLDMAALVETQLIGDLADMVHYSGSLTTPPCSQDVSWLVLGQYLTLSTSQLSAFTALYSGNNRDTQPLNGRELSYDEDFSQ